MLDTGTAMCLADRRWGLSFISSTAWIRGTNERENFLDAFSILYLTLSTAAHSTSTSPAEATKELSTLYSSLISPSVHSSCLPAYCVSPLLIIITCFLSLLVSLPFTHCLQLHTYSQRGGCMGRKSECERKKEGRERVASICVLSFLFSWARTWVTSSLTCQWKRKNWQIVFPRCYAANCSESQEKAGFDYPSFPILLNYVVLSCSVFSKLNTRNNCDNCLFLNKEPEWVWQFPPNKIPYVLRVKSEYFFVFLGNRSVLMGLYNDRTEK